MIYTYTRFNLCFLCIKMVVLCLEGFHSEISISSTYQDSCKKSWRFWSQRCWAEFCICRFLLLVLKLWSCVREIKLCWNHKRELGSLWLWTTSAENNSKVWLFSLLPEPLLEGTNLVPKHRTWMHLTARLWCCVSMSPHSLWHRQVLSAFELYKHNHKLDSPIVQYRFPLCLETEL